MRRAQHLIGIVLVLALSGSSIATAVLVVCVASDGHVAVESAGALCCLRAAASGSPVVSEMASCDGCSDYSLVVTGEARTGSTAHSFRAWAPLANIEPVPPIALAVSEHLTAFPLPQVCPDFALRC